MTGMEVAGTLDVEPDRPGRDPSSTVWLLGDPAPTPPLSASVVSSDLQLIISTTLDFGRLSRKLPAHSRGSGESFSLSVFTNVLLIAVSPWPRYLTSLYRGNNRSTYRIVLL